MANLTIFLAILWEFKEFIIGATAFLSLVIGTVVYIIKAIKEEV